MRLLLLAIIFLPASLMAGEISIQAHAGSVHWIDVSEQNENNPGAGLVYDNDDGLSVLAGGYYNTQRTGTGYLAFGGHVDGWGGRHRFLLGGATGYEGHSVYPMFGWQFTTHGLLGTLLPGAFGYGGEKRLLSW